MLVSVSSYASIAHRARPLIGDCAAETAADYFSLAFSHVMHSPSSSLSLLLSKMYTLAEGADSCSKGRIKMLPGASLREEAAWSPLRKPAAYPLPPSPPSPPLKSPQRRSASTCSGLALHTHPRHPSKRIATNQRSAHSTVADLQRRFPCAPITD